MELTPAGATSKTKQAVIAISVILAVLIVVGAIVLAEQRKDETAVGGAASATPAPASATPDPSATYKDGTYQASGAYMSPGGNEVIDVTVTIKDNVVTDTDIEQDPSSRDAERYQRDFREGYEQFVVGKKLSDIRLSHVSGSSLTSGGFNRALEQIREQAEQS